MVAGGLDRCLTLLSLPVDTLNQEFKLLCAKIIEFAVINTS